MYSKGVFRDIIAPFGGFILIVALFLGVAGLLTGCSDNGGTDSFYFGTMPRYTYAYVQLPNGEIVEGSLDDYAIGSHDGGVRVKINGNWYYTSNMNCVLTDKNPN